jgi:hypothetical protein
VDESNAWQPVAQVAIQVLQLVGRALGFKRLIWSLDERIITFTGRTWLTTPGKPLGQIGQTATLTKKAQKAAKRAKKARDGDLPTTFDPFSPPEVGQEHLVLSCGFEGQPERFVIAIVPGTKMGDSDCINWVRPVIEFVMGRLKRPWVFVADARWGDEDSVKAALDIQPAPAAVVVRTEIRGTLRNDGSRMAKRTVRRKEDGRVQWNTKEHAHLLFKESYQYPGRPGEYFAVCTRGLRLGKVPQRTVVFHYYPKPKAPPVEDGDMVVGVHVNVRAVACTLPATYEGGLAALKLYEARWDLSETGIKEVKKHEAKGGGTDFAPRCLATAVSLMAILIATAVLFFQRRRLAKGELAAILGVVVRRVWTRLDAIVEACGEPPT